MKEPDWARGWELLEQYKKSLSSTRLGLQKPLLDAIAELLNKQDTAGYTLLRQFFIQESALRFNEKYVSKVYAYREWFDARVELTGEHYKDVDEAYRQAFDAKYKI